MWYINRKNRKFLHCVIKFTLNMTFIHFLIIKHTYFDNLIKVNHQRLSETEFFLDRKGLKLAAKCTYVLSNLLVCLKRQ